jgi:hypothetical protein
MHSFYVESVTAPPACIVVLGLCGSCQLAPVNVHVTPAIIHAQIARAHWFTLAIQWRQQLLWISAVPALGHTLPAGATRLVLQQPGKARRAGQANPSRGDRSQML